MCSENLQAELKVFDGYATVKELKDSCKRIPEKNGIYEVFREITKEKPVFMEKGTGGKQKGKDLNYPISKLEAKWIDDETVMYIGKSTNLRKRISTYMRYGSGKDASHRGGRAIWQLPDSDELIVAWKILPSNISAKDIETKLIREFKTSHGDRRPFANIID